MTIDFWKALLVRVAKTWCQAFVSVIGIDAYKTLGDVDWKYAFSVATLAGIVCLVWNLGAGLPEVQLAETLYTFDNAGEIEPDYKVEEGEDE